MSQEESRILIMRHPETEANVTHWLSGRRDVELTKKGVEQAARAAEALVAWKPDRILTSPLRRCHAVADVAAQHLGLDVVDEPDLLEMDFGVVEGSRHEQLAELGLTFPWSFDESGHSVVAEGAESFEQIIERGQRMLDKLMELPGRTVCLTHGGFTRALLAAAYGADVHKFWYQSVANVSSTVLSCSRGHFYLEAFGLTPDDVIRRMADPSLDMLINSKGEY